MNLSTRMDDGSPELLITNLEEFIRNEPLCENQKTKTVDQGTQTKKSMKTAHIEATSEEEFLSHLNLSKCSSNKQKNAKTRSSFVNRPFTRYTQYVTNRKGKHCLTGSNESQRNLTETRSHGKRKRASLTLTEKIGKLKRSCESEDKLKKTTTKNSTSDNAEKTKLLGDKTTQPSAETQSPLENSELACKPCNFSCFSKKEFEEHNAKITHIIKADICKGTDHLTLQKEKQRFKGLKMPTTCSTCSFEFSDRDKFIRHYRAHVKSMPYKCVRCDSKFHHRNDLGNHLKRHLGVKNIKCQYCNMTFSKTCGLESHLVSKHEKSDSRPRNFKCTECGHAFLTKLAVNRHMRWHTGYRPESCHLCGQGFHTKYDLQQHKRVHSGEKPFQCNQCSYTARTAQLLKRHTLSHTKEKAYSCEHCDFACNFSTGLKRHMRQHTGKKPYKCPYCRHRCSSIENLRKHIKKVKKHQGLKIYPCSLCMSFATDDGSEYLQHMKKVHFPYLDLRVTVATKLSGILVDENKISEDPESETEDEVAIRMFSTSSRDLISDTRDSLTLDSMQPSLTTPTNILPHIGINSTIDNLNENDLRCLDSHVRNIPPCLEKGDILLSSMAPLGNGHLCKTGAFSSSDVFMSDNMPESRQGYETATNNPMFGQGYRPVDQSSSENGGPLSNNFMVSHSENLPLLVKYSNAPRVEDSQKEMVVPLTLVVNSTPDYNDIRPSKDDSVENECNSSVLSNTVVENQSASNHVNTDDQGFICGEDSKTAYIVTSNGQLFITDGSKEPVTLLHSACFRPISQKPLTSRAVPFGNVLTTSDALHNSTGGFEHRRLKTNDLNLVQETKEMMGNPSDKVVKNPSAIPTNFVNLMADSEHKSAFMTVDRKE